MLLILLRGLVEDKVNLGERKSARTGAAAAAAAAFAPFLLHLVPGQDVIQGEPARASPGDRSSPGQAQPLPGAQQPSPPRGESQRQEDTHTDEATADGKEPSDENGSAGPERGRLEEDPEPAAGEQTGLALPEGSDDGQDEDEEPTDANNNSMETPQNRRENVITIPEMSEQVSGQLGRLLGLIRAATVPLLGPAG